MGISGTLCGGYDGAERKAVCFNGGLPPVKYIMIRPKSKRFSDPLTHRDILGALMSLGIKRETLGDILIAEDEYAVICFDKVSKFIADNLKSVKHTAVNCEILNGLTESFTSKLSDNSTIMAVFTSSLRIDSLIAAVYKLSRGQAQNLISAEKVFSDGRLVISPSFIPCEQAQISVRGYGRFYLDGSPAETKKGRKKCTVCKK